MQIEDVIAESTRRIAEVNPQSADEVRFAGATLIGYSPAMAAAEKALKEFLYQRVYRSDEVMGPVRRSEKVVAELFDHYMAAADMPGRWGEAARNAGDRGMRAGIVADFIAGMTDPYAEEQHARLAT